MCSGLERTDFNSFYFGKVVGGCSLDRTDFNSFYFGVWVLKVLDLTVSTLGRYGSLERTEFNSFYFGKVWQS